jgi:hypothetical protein
MTKFKEGQSGNPKGRPRGARNRTSEEIRQSLLKLVDDNLANLQKDFKGLKGKDRALLIISLAKHCTPPALNPEKLTEDQLQQICEYFKKQIHEQAINKK